MTDKQIMIDGVKYNPCNSCKLWNGHHCIGARSYEPNADEHRAICNEHMANQFHKVYQQLYRKTQECEQKEKELLSNEKIINKLMKEVDELKQECEELKKRATIAEDNFACEVRARLYHQKEWLKFSKECEELKKELNGSEKWRIKAESLNEKLELNNDRYRKALEEIEEYINSQGINNKWNMRIQRFRLGILDIISKAKGGN